MNCKPGDLAVLVHTMPNAASALWTIVHLTSACIVSGEQAWNYEGMPLRGRHPRGTWTWHELPDAWLRPITPPAGTVDESEVSALYLPSPEKIEEAESIKDHFALLGTQAIRGSTGRGA